MIGLIAGSAVIILLFVIVIIRCTKPKVKIVEKEEVENGSLYNPDDIIDLSGNFSRDVKRDTLLAQNAIN